MVSYIIALRTVVATYAKRIIQISGWIGLGVFILLLATTWLLAHYLSSYWWLTLIFILPLGLIGLVIFFVSHLIANTIQGRQLSRPQRKLIGNYLDKVQAIVEATQLSMGFLLFVIAKDLLLHRNLQTLEGFIGDSTSLKRDLDILAAEL